MSWTRPSASGPAPSARCAHTTTACCIENGSGKLFVFGGWNGTRMLNDLQIFYTDPMAWSKPITTGTVPGIRAGHTMTAVGTKLFIFGGGDGNHYLNDLHILDTETMAWSQAYVAGTSPAARSRHTTTLVGTKLYVFGGGDDSRVYNDLYVLDTETMSWSRPPTKGVPPAARWGHTTTLIGEGKLMVFGGHDGTAMLSDLHVLDTSSLTWTQAFPPKSESNPNVGPSARAGHTATLINGNMLLIFGGGDGSKILNDVWLLDTTSLTWIRPTISGNAPPARCAHTSTMLDKKLIVFGGGDGARRFKDLYVLETGNSLVQGVNSSDGIHTEHILKNEDKKSKAKKAAKQRKDKGKSEEKAKDITSWLATLGMKKYAEKFISQEIDMDTVIYLTEAHLEQLGVTTMGARIRILNAVKALRRSSKDTEEKETDLSELAMALKESVDSLTTSTNQLSDIFRAMQQDPKKNKIQTSIKRAVADGGVDNIQNHVLNGKA